MSLKLNNSEKAEYTVVTTYEDGNKVYSTAFTDYVLANDHIDKLKLSLFSSFGRVKKIDMIKKTTTVKEDHMRISRF